MVDAAVKEFGGVDIAVNNAGLRRQTPFLQMTLDEWHEILSVALDGAFILAKACAPEMIKRGGGTLIGLSGISHHAGAVGRVHVNASKAGLEGFIRGLAMELAPHGITANCVAPGSIDTVRGPSAGGPHGRGGVARGSRSGGRAGPRRSPRWCASWPDRKAAISPAKRSTSTAACSWASSRPAGAAPGRVPRRGGLATRPGRWSRTPFRTCLSCCCC